MAMKPLTMYPWKPTDLSTASAFANKAGGVILLSLDEKDRFITHGVEDPKRFARDTDRLRTEKISSPFRTSIEEMSLSVHTEPHSGDSYEKLPAHELAHVDPNC